MKMKIIINKDKKKADIGDLYGIFFEDINHAADGGVYSEMVQNRAFAFESIDNKSYTPFTAWTIEGLEASVETSDALYPKNPTYAHLRGKGTITNEGFCGIALEKGGEYTLTLTAKGSDITVSLLGEKGVYARVNAALKNSWDKYSFTLASNETDYAAKLEVAVDGETYLDCVSLTPSDAPIYRRDLEKLLCDLKPDFMRFPGGCLVHDGSLNPTDRDALYFWKNSVSQDPFARPPRRNNWGYNQTLGLGYYEYFMLCERIGATPLPVLAAAYNPHRHAAAPFSEMEWWVQDALDLIEFANGDTTTLYGALRASLGHEKPFNMKYLAIGNEEVGIEFCERYPYFAKAIAEKHPEIRLLSSSGPFANGAEFDRFWDFSKKAGAWGVDEHYYQNTHWFLDNVHRYDSYERGTSRVFLGEWATWGRSLYHAVCEAAYMCHLEQNADVVALSCYAPLFCNQNYINWQPDMIWYNNHQSCGIPSYYVQKLFMNNKGAEEIECVIEGNTKKVEKDEPLIQNFEFDTRGGACEITDERTEGGKWSAKAKKLSGGKGFDITFAKDGDSFYKWELGGWANDFTIIGRNHDNGYSCIEYGDAFTVEKGREYLLEMEITGRNIVCRVDGEIVQTLNAPVMEEETLHACASLDADDVILKVVNVSGESVEASFNAFGKRALVTTLTGGKDETNTPENPFNIVPKEEKIECGETMEYTFLPYSVNIFRFKK